MGNILEETTHNPIWNTFIIPGKLALGHIIKPTLPVH